MPRDFTSKEVVPTTVKVNKEVILSTATTHGPQVLQLSGCSPRGLLNSAGIQTRIDLPNIGQILHDHSGLDHVMSRKMRSTFIIGGGN